MLLYDSLEPFCSLSKKEPSTYLLGLHLYNIFSWDYVRYCFGIILVHVLLYNILVHYWDENFVYFFKLRKKNCFGPIIFMTNYCDMYRPKITYKNIVKEDMNKFYVCTIFLFHGACIIQFITPSKTLDSNFFNYLTFTHGFCNSI